MSHEPDVFGYLATSKISEVTTTLLDESTKNTYANKSNVKFWKGPISIWATVRATRTYPGALPIPEESGIHVLTLEAAGADTLRPEGTEIWVVKGIVGTGVDGTATASLFWHDGTSQVEIDTAPTNFTTGGNHFLYSDTPPISNSEPIILTNTLYLSFVETGGAQGVIFNIAYHKVSL